MSEGKTEVVSISLPAVLLRWADAKRGDISRSKFFSRIIEAEQKKTQEARRQSVVHD